MKFYLVLTKILPLIIFVFLNISCSSTEDYDNSDFTSNVSNSIGGGEPPFIIVGDRGTILKSVDGINWQNNSISTTANFLNVTYGNYTFLISGSQVNDKNLTFTSNGGSNWTDVTFDFGYGNTGKSAFGLNKFVVTANNKVYYATLGSNWFASTVGSGEIRSIFFSDGIFYITQGTNIYMSENLTSWTNPVITGNWNDITVGNDLVVAVGSDSSNVNVKYFQFGSWISAEVPNADSSLKSIAFGNNVFTITTTGSYHTTRDLSNWTKTSSAAIPNDITFRKGIFVAVGESGLIQTSPDGYTWTTRTSGTTENLRDVY